MNIDLVSTCPEKDWVTKFSVLKATCQQMNESLSDFLFADMFVTIYWI